MKTNAKPDSETHVPFLFAEECGLALLKHRPSGKKMCMEKAIWSDLESSLKAGWQPQHR